MLIVALPKPIFDPPSNALVQIAIYLEDGKNYFF
jgi:hypothetical protein